MHIRLLAPADIPAADAILMAAFENNEPRAADLRRYLELQPDGWLVAEQDGRLVGMGGAMAYDAFAYIGLMAVDPACQRQGIGRAIIARILHWIDQRGLPALLDASRLGYPLYASLGFLPVDEAHVYLCAQPPLAVPPPSGVYPLQESDLAELHALDTAAFGGDRRAVLRILQRDFPQGGLLRRDESGRIGGYLIAKGRRIGPWVAHTPQDAEALLLAALTLPLDGPLLTILPGQNHIGPPLLERYGFRLVRSLRHMRRGVVQSPEKRQWIYGQTSFAIG